MCGVFFVLVVLVVCRACQGEAVADDERVRGGRQGRPAGLEGMAEHLLWHEQARPHRLHQRELAYVEPETRYTYDRLEL